MVAYSSRPLKNSTHLLNTADFMFAVCFLQEQTGQWLESGVLHGERMMEESQRGIRHRGNSVVGHRPDRQEEMSVGTSKDKQPPRIFTTTRQVCPFLPQTLLAFHCATLHAKASSHWALDCVTFPFQGSLRLTATMTMTGISWKAAGKIAVWSIFTKEQQQCTEKLANTLI